MAREDFDYENLAREISKSITIRNYDDYGSHDTTREATKVESEIIFNILCGVFGAYRYRSDANLDSILDVAEMTLHRFIPNANSYDTIYIPVRNVLGWR